MARRRSPKPIALTSQEIAICWWCMSLLFVCLVFAFSYREVVNGVLFLYLDELTMGFFLAMSIIFSLIGVIWLSWPISKYNLNMNMDRLHHDWQGVIRVDKNGMMHQTLMEKDSLGYDKGVALGKKIGLIQKEGLKLTLPNGNSVLLTFDVMSHNIDMLEALGWMLYKKKYKVVGYDAYKVYLNETKPELIEGNND